MYKRIMIIMAMAIFTATSAFAMCGMCGTGADKQSGKKTASVFSHVAGEAAMNNGVKEISYEQFMKIRNGNEKYILLDVLPTDSYNKGHIEGATSFPADSINKDSAYKILPKDSKIIVYCGSFKCSASTEAAKKLSALGYSVLDYKGGLKEWQEKDNRLAK